MPQHAWRFLSTAATLSMLVCALLLATAWRPREMTRAASPAQAPAARSAAPAKAPATPAALTVSGVAERTLAADARTQPITLRGTGFGPGLAVTITSPREVMTTFGADACTGLTAGTCTLPALLDEHGTYRVVVRMPGLGQSAPATFTVK